MNMTRVQLPSLIFLLASVAGQVRGSTLSQSGFGPTAQTEGFEGIVSGTNLAVVAPYTFRSGLQLVSPPPGNYGTFGPYVVGDGFYGLSGGQDVPDGTAYLGQANPGLFTAPIELQLPTASSRIGAYVSTSLAQGTACQDTMEALDAQGDVLASFVVTNVSEGQWSNNFVTLSSSTPISDVEFIGNHAGVLRIDDLTWQPTTVPEPVCLPAVAAALVLLRRRHRHQRGHSERALYTWGRGVEGELGNGTTANSLVPVPVTGLSSGATAAAGGFHFSMALRNGNVYAWGANDGGVLANSSTSFQTTPLEIDPTDLNSIIANAAVDDDAYALSSNGSLWVWGGLV